jgi:hypothetical protein
MPLDRCIDLQDIPIPFGILEEQGTMSILPAARRFEDLNAFSEQLQMAAIHLSGCYAKGELNTGRMRMPRTVIRTSAPAQGQKAPPTGISSQPSKSRCMGRPSTS